jgi:hypothetical protein
VIGSSSRGWTPSDRGRSGCTSPHADGLAVSSEKVKTGSLHGRGQG